MIHCKDNMLPIKYSLVDFHHFIFTRKQMIYPSTNFLNDYQTYLNLPSHPYAKNSLSDYNYRSHINYRSNIETVSPIFLKSTWIAYASLSATNSKYLSESSVELQSLLELTSSQSVIPHSQAVRLLLKELLAKHGLKLVSKKDISLSLLYQTYLDETVFPYRLQPQGYYVCFSHSHPIIACAISIDRPIGVDVEMREIPLSVAKRFYHPDEVLWLNRQPSATQKLAIKILWMIKEAYIKHQGLPTLMYGLKSNQLHLVKLLLFHLKDDDNVDNEFVKVIHLKSQALVLAPYLYKEIDFTYVRFGPSYSTLVYFLKLPLIVLQ